jgi:hypothetical protein
MTDVVQSSRPHQAAELILETVVHYRDENRRLRQVEQNMLPVFKAAKAMTHLVQWFQGQDEELIAVSVGELRRLAAAVAAAEGNQR